ncbi:MAG TPA: hypothetical protein VJN22_01185 [Candidatus Eremiobacteraceae bacterium]|nr:hypothetical protein [Candidatus Eremiobacteraceae bacterium]
MTTVVGIFPNQASVTTLLGALSAAGHDVSTVQILSTSDVPTEIANTGAQYTWIGDVDRGIDVGSITNMGGVGVPGLAAGNRTEGVVYGDSVNDYLASLNVPDGRSDDYAIAVESGRLVAGMPLDDAANADAARKIFSSAGATVVDAFPPL